MIATYHGTCDLCGLSYTPGDQIAPRKDGYVHTACAERE